MVVTRHRGQILLTVRGPETKATIAECPAGGEWMGIHFKLGTFMPALRPGSLRDRNDLNLPQASARTFLLEGSAWEYPTYENAEVFVERLVRRGLIAKDACVEASLEGDPTRLSRRTVQRHFLESMGISPKTVSQIERAREAIQLLRRGVAILDVAYGLGYFDQAHLTQSLRRFAGLTPALLARGVEQLSLFYNTRQPDSTILHADDRCLRAP